MKKYDAIIIGAGIIGCTTAFELAKKGYKTLNIDKEADAGLGSTVNSCAIVRAHYSTYDGVTLAYEGFQYWKNWADYLEVEDERGLAKFMNCGTILLKSKGHDWRKVVTQYRNIGVPHEEWIWTRWAKECPFTPTTLSGRWPAPKMRVSGMSRLKSWKGPFTPPIPAT